MDLEFNAVLERKQATDPLKGCAIDPRGREHDAKEFSLPP